MVEKPKKHNKLSFSEEDAATLLQRYDATTVLKLLQEVEIYAHLAIDWNELVKKTSTGISHAREYQMLWRHLAYREALPEKFDDGAEPLDDDSDLECELEAVPPPSNDIASEVAAYVKVLISSSKLNESSPSSSTIEAPLPINVPICPSSRACKENLQPSFLMEGSSIIFPVTVPRQTVPSVSSTECLDANRSASGNSNNKRKRNAWSKEEDMQLQAAVQKHGEGNWATLLNEVDFPIKKTLAQLVQRWNMLKKGGGINPETNSVSPHFTAEQLATRHSLSLALDMPFKKLTATGMTDPGRTSLNTMAKNPMLPSNAAQASTVQSSSKQALDLSQLALLGPYCSAKSKVVPEKAVPKSNLGPDSAVRAAAVAAGACIISQSEIASPPKATDGGNGAYIMPTSGPSMNSSISAGLHSHLKAHSNIPDVCTGLKHKPISSNSVVTITPVASCNSVVDASSLVVEKPTLVSSSILSEQNDHVSSMANEVPVRQEISRLEESKGSYPPLVPKKEVQNDESSPVKKEGQAVLQNPVLNENQGSVKNSDVILNTEAAENHHKAVDCSSNNEMEGSNHNRTVYLHVTDGSNCHSAVSGSSGVQSINEKQENLLS